MSSIRSKRSDSASVRFDRFLDISPYLVLTMVLLTPNIKVASLPAFRTEQIFILIILLIEWDIHGIRRVRKIIDGKLVALMICSALYIVITILYGRIKGFPIRYNDFFELFKVYLYFGFYLYFRFTMKKGTERKLLGAFLVFTFVTSIIAISQYFNPWNMNEKYVQYLAPTQYVTLVNDYPSPRVIGMMVNPNYYSIVVSIAAMVSFYFFLKSNMRRSLLLTVYFFIILLMTKSRTGFIYFIAGIFILTFLSFIESVRRYSGSYIPPEEKKQDLRREKVRSVVIFVGIIVSVALLFFFGPESLIWRLKHALNILEDRSFITRVERWKEYIEFYNIPSLMGIGSTKGNLLPFQVDNEWLILLKEYGILGTGVLVWIFCKPYRRRGSSYQSIYGAIMLSGALFMLTSVYLSIHQLIPLYMFFYVLANNKDWRTD